MCVAAPWQHAIACQGRCHSPPASYGSDRSVTRRSAGWQNDTPFCIVVDLPQLLLLASVVRVGADHAWQWQPHETATRMKTSVDVELLHGAERTCRAASWWHPAAGRQIRRQCWLARSNQRWSMHCSIELGNVDRSDVSQRITCFYFHTSANVTLSSWKLRQMQVIRNNLSLLCAQGEIAGRRQLTQQFSATAQYC